MATSSKSIGRSGANYRVARFDGNGDFGTRKMKVEAVLKKEKTYGVVYTPEKLKDMDATDLEEIEDEALTIIQLSLSNEVLREFSQKKTTKELWMHYHMHIMTSLSLIRLFFNNNFIHSR